MKESSQVNHEPSRPVDSSSAKRDKAPGFLSRNWAPLAATALALSMFDMAAAGAVGSDKKVLVGETVGQFVHDGVDETIDFIEAIANAS